MFSTALTSTPISPMQRKVGRSISGSPAPLPLTKSNTSATRQDCQLLPTSLRLSGSSLAILLAPGSLEIVVLNHGGPERSRTSDLRFRKPFQPSIYQSVTPRTHEPSPRLP